MEDKEIESRFAVLLLSEQYMTTDLLKILTLFSILEKRKTIKHFDYTITTLRQIPKDLALHLDLATGYIAGTNSDGAIIKIQHLYVDPTTKTQYLFSWLLESPIMHVATAEIDYNYSFEYFLSIYACVRLGEGHEADRELNLSSGEFEDEKNALIIGEDDIPLTGTTGQELILLQSRINDIVEMMERRYTAGSLPVVPAHAT